jgi:hypothetical protein
VQESRTAAALRDTRRNFMVHVGAFDLQRGWGRCGGDGLRAGRKIQVLVQRSAILHGGDTTRFRTLEAGSQRCDRAGYGSSVLMVYRLSPFESIVEVTPGASVVMMIVALGTTTRA